MNKYSKMGGFYVHRLLVFQVVNDLVSDNGPQGVYRSYYPDIWVEIQPWSRFCA